MFKNDLQFFDDPRNTDYCFDYMKNSVKYMVFHVAITLLKIAVTVGCLLNQIFGSILMLTIPSFYNTTDILSSEKYPCDALCLIFHQDLWESHFNPRIMWWKAYLYFVRGCCVLQSIIQPSRNFLKNSTQFLVWRLSEWWKVTILEERKNENDSQNKDDLKENDQR